MAKGVNYKRKLSFLIMLAFLSVAANAKQQKERSTDGCDTTSGCLLPITSKI